MKLNVESTAMLDRVLFDATGIGIDAGANEGGYTQRMLDFGLEVHAFEPVPDVLEKLERRFAGEPRVVVNQLGLSDAPSILENVTVLQCWTLATAGTCGFDTALDYVGKPPFNVHCTTLDEYLAGRTVGFIKLDVDGFEHKVLMGAKETLRTRPPIMCELNCYIHKMGGSPEQFMHLVFSRGYTVVPMDGSARFDSWKEIEPHWPYHSSFDVMFMPNDFQPL